MHVKEATKQALTPLHHVKRRTRTRVAAENRGMGLLHSGNQRGKAASTQHRGLT